MSLCDTPHEYGGEMLFCKKRRGHKIPHKFELHTSSEDVVIFYAAKWETRDGVPTWEVHEKKRTRRTHR